MKYNKSEIMKRAWKFVRNAKITIAEALKRSWAIAKLTAERIIIKSWFLAKNFTQNERYVINSAMMCGELEILKETEKALFLKADSDFGAFRFWCPKSCLEK